MWVANNCSFWVNYIRAAPDSVSQSLASRNTSSTHTHFVLSTCALTCCLSMRARANLLLVYVCVRACVQTLQVQRDIKTKERARETLSRRYRYRAVVRVQVRGQGCVVCTDWVVGVADCSSCCQRRLHDSADFFCHWAVMRHLNQHVCVALCAVYVSLCVCVNRTLVVCLTD